jgi:hypothetical protein
VPVELVVAEAPSRLDDCPVLRCKAADVPPSVVKLDELRGLVFRFRSRLTGMAPVTHEALRDVFDSPVQRESEKEISVLKHLPESLIPTSDRTKRQTTHD